MLKFQSNIETSPSTGTGLMKGCTLLHTRMKKTKRTIHAAFEGISGFPSNPGEYTSSPTFDDHWSCRIYPGGVDGSSQGFIGCYIAYNGPGIARASFKLGIVNQKGWKNKEYVSEIKSFSSIDSEHNKNIHGDAKFIAYESLKVNDNGIIESDSLSIKVVLCRYGNIEHNIKFCCSGIGSPSSPTSGSGSASISTLPRSHASVASRDEQCVSLLGEQFAFPSVAFASEPIDKSLISDLASLLSDDSLADTTLIVKELIQNETNEQLNLNKLNSDLTDNAAFKTKVLDAAIKETRFPVHKVLLCMRSPVFKAMLVDNDMVECANKTVVIEDFPASVVQALLSYIYTGTFKSSSEDLDLQLLAAACKWQVTPLIGVCENKLCNMMSPANVSSFLFVADRWDIQRLKQTALMYIAHNSKDIVSDEFFDTLSLPLLREVVKALSATRENIG